MDSQDLSVLGRALEWLDAGRRVVLVTLLATWGPAPRPVGALLALDEDGQPWGSVSGGCVEEQLGERVRTCFPESCELVNVGVTAGQARRAGLPCGGTLQLLLEPLGDASSLRPVVAALVRGERIARRLELASGAVSCHPAAAGDRQTFDGHSLTQILGPRWRLLLIGAGQISHYLASMAQALDYRVLIGEPRTEYAANWRLPGAELLPGMPDDLVRDLAPDQHTAVVALTHDPRLDDVALMEALQSDAFYVGALGSQASSAQRRARLAQLDITPEQLARLRGPVGLPLGGRTPPEIALAVLAELTALRHGVHLLVAPAPSAPEEEPPAGPRPG